MLILVGLIILVMVLFAALTARSEILLYRKAVKGEVEYMISLKRRNRRLLISLILILEAVFLFLGFFLLKFDKPADALLFWLAPLLLIFALAYLGIADLRQTAKDIDRIFVESALDALKKAKDQKQR